MLTEEQRLKRNERARAWRAKNREKYLTRKRETYTAAPPEVKQKKKDYDAAYRCRPEVRERHREYRTGYWEQNKETLRAYNRDYQIKQKYGLTSDERHALYLQQNCACRICRKPLPEFGKRTHIDHCHTTGRVRGILCSRCNTGVGWFENIDAESVTEYLRDADDSSGENHSGQRFPHGTPAHDVRSALS